MHLSSAADRELVAAVVSSLRDALGRDPLGLYVFGSATVGGLRPDSDLDLLAVVERPVTPAEKKVLANRLGEISRGGVGAERWRPVELTILVAAQVRPWRYPPTMDFQYGDWLRGELERDDAPAWQPSPNPDLAVLVTMTLTSGRPVLGPPASELFDPVPFGDVERSIVDGLPALRGGLGSDTRNVILTLARGWMTVATREIASKDTAANWALGQLPPHHRLPLVRARDLYLAGGDDDRLEITYADIAAHADYVISRIKTSVEAGAAPSNTGPGERP